MHDTRLVGREHARGDLPGDRHHAGHGQPARLLQDARQILAFEIRHRDVLDAVDLAQVVNADDVLVGDLPGEQQFLLEPALDVARGGRISGHFRPDHFQRHHHAELAVPGLVDRAHAADAKQLHDDVARTELLADAEGTCGIHRP